MDYKTCGACSQKHGFTLDQRIELALSRIFNQEYKCGVCSMVHVLKSKFVPVFSNYPTPLPVVSMQFPEPSFVRKPEQLELFGVYEHVKNLKNAFDLGTNLDCRV